jgi:hypothetical protein
MKDKFLVGIMLIIFMIFLPYMVTLIVNGGGSGSKSVLEGVSTGRDVLITQSGKNYLVDVEEFVGMCLPALIEWDSDLELIEAQAVAVRSRIIYLMGSDKVINADDLSYTYFTEQELKELFGSSSYLKAKKIYEQAVYNTLGAVS